MVAVGVVRRDEGALRVKNTNEMNHVSLCVDSAGIPAGGIFQQKVMRCIPTRDVKAMLSMLL